MSKSGEFHPIFVPAFSALEVVGLLALGGLALMVRAYYEQRAIIAEQMHEIDRLIDAEVERGDAAARAATRFERDLGGLDA